MKVSDEDLILIAEKLSQDFTFYSKKRIFLTGGTGFFGKWLLEAFIYLNTQYNLNIKVTVLSRSPENFKASFPHFFEQKNFQFISGDIRSFDAPVTTYDLIIHAATDASASLNKSEPKLMHNTIMDGSKRICEFAKKVNCQRILYTSSGAAYGSQPESLTHMPETFVDNPLFNHNDAYASAKLESEKYFKENTPCDIVIARCFAFSGPYLPLNSSYAFGNFIGDVLNDRDIIIKGDGTAVRSYLYAADLVIWLLRLLSSGESGETYNVGSTKEISVYDLANKINAKSIHENNVEVSKNKSVKINRYVPNVDKIKSHLNVEVYTTLDEAIYKTICFYSGEIPKPRI